MNGAPVLRVAPPWTAFLAIAACVSTKGIKQPVRSVTVNGNQAFEDKAIVEGLATRPPRGTVFKTAQEFDAIGLELDRKRVEAFYRTRGYFDAHVRDVAVKKGTKGNIAVTITVDEGEPTRVATLDVSGADPLVARRLFNETSPLRAGSVFDHPAYVTAKDALQAALVKQGHAHAEVTGVVEVDRSRHRAIVRLRANPGPLVRFGPLAVRGQGKVPASAIRNRVAWKQGAIFDPKKIKTTEGRLYALGLFSSVRTTWAQEGDPTVTPMTVQVAEGSRHELRLGFGGGIDQSRYVVQTHIRFTQRRFLGAPLTTFQADVTPGWSWLRTDGTSSPSIEAALTVSREDLFLPRVTGSALVAYQRDPREGYILSGPRLALAARRPFFDDDRLNLHIGWKLHYLSFIDADPLVFGDAATASRMGYFEQRLVFDRRDKPLDARRGLYLDVLVNEGGTFAGGEIEFFKVTAEARGYLSLLPQVVLAGRAMTGMLTTTADESPLPVRYYGGGATDHRGFGYQRLSPQKRDSNGTPISTGGDGLLLATLEGRIDMFKLSKEWVSLALFVDTGDVVTPYSALDLGNLHWAAGVGLRYDTVIGPVRVDLGLRLNRTGVAGEDGLANPDPGSSWAFHISLGEAF